MITMFTTRKRRAERERCSRDRRRFEVARTIYSTVITHCYRNAHTVQEYERVQQIAAAKTVIFADALLAELEKKGGKQ